MLNADALAPVISTLSMVTSVPPGLEMVTVASAALPVTFTLEGSAVMPRGLSVEPDALSVGKGVEPGPEVPPVDPPAVEVLVTPGEEFWDAEFLLVCFPPTPSRRGISTASPVTVAAIPEMSPGTVIQNDFLPSAMRQLLSHLGCRCVGRPTLGALAAQDPGSLHAAPRARQYRPGYLPVLRRSTPGAFPPNRPGR